MLVGNAIQQLGPWQNEDIKLTPEWLIDKLIIKVNQIDWVLAKEDVARFLKPRELVSLEVWSKDFFLSRVEKLSQYL